MRVWRMALSKPGAQWTQAGPGTHRSCKRRFLTSQHRRPSIPPLRQPRTAQRSHDESCLQPLTSSWEGAQGSWTPFSGAQRAQPCQTLTACILQPDQAVEEVIEAQLEFLVCVPEDSQLQEVTAQLEACGEERGDVNSGPSVPLGSAQCSVCKVQVPRPSGDRRPQTMHVYTS